MSPAKEHKISEMCTECFLLLLHFRSTSDLGDFSSLRSQITGAIREVEKNARQANHSNSIIHSIKIALVAFFDETILGSSWLHRDQWSHNTLSLELLGHMQFGQEFYKELDQLLASRSGNKEVLEIYYTCLSIGFKGKYLIRDTGKPQEYKDRIIDRLSHGNNGSNDSVLAPHGYSRESLPESVSSESNFLWLTATVLTTLLIISYFFLKISSKTL